MEMVNKTPTEILKKPCFNKQNKGKSYYKLSSVWKRKRSV